MSAVNRLFARLLTVVLALTLSVQPALAQSILRDAETEILLHDMATPLIRAAGLDPRNVSVVLVGDMSINAFVAGGQTVYACDWGPPSTRSTGSNTPGRRSGARSPAPSRR